MADTQSASEEVDVVVESIVQMLARFPDDIEIVAELRRICNEERRDRGDLTQRTEFGVLRDEVMLSVREREILTLLANGRTNREIASSLYLAESTVKTYLKRVYRKLGIHSRTQAVLRAVELGLVTPKSLMIENG